MNILWSQADVTDGVAQEARLPYALEPGYFLPQERALHDHLAIASRMSELVRLPAGSGGLHSIGAPCSRQSRRLPWPKC